MEKNDAVVIFIFLKNGKILIEKRAVKNYEGQQYLIPGGRVKKSLENLEQALTREIKEELGVDLLEFIPLPITEEITGIHGQSLNPFLITSWEGDLPEVVLDRGNPLIWLTIDEVLTTPIIPTRKIIEALQLFLSKK